MKRIRRWILRHLGILHAIDVAESEILENISIIGIDEDWEDEITDIIMTALSKVRSGELK